MAKPKIIADKKQSAATVLGIEASLAGAKPSTKSVKEGKAASKKQIPFAPAAKESPTEGRMAPIARIKQRGPSITCFSELPAWRSSRVGIFSPPSRLVAEHHGIMG